MDKRFEGYDEPIPEEELKEFIEYWEIKNRESEV
jgi:hypothetical protein